METLVIFGIICAAAVAILVRVRGVILKRGANACSCSSCPLSQEQRAMCASAIVHDKAHEMREDTV